MIPNMPDEQTLPKTANFRALLMPIIIDHSVALQLGGVGAVWKTSKKEKSRQHTAKATRYTNYFFFEISFPMKREKTAYGTTQRPSLSQGKRKHQGSETPRGPTNH